MFNDAVRFYPIVFGTLLFRYLFIAGCAFLVCYVILRGALRGRKIQAAFPAFPDYAREIGYSLLTILIFTGIGWLAMGPHWRPHTLWYYRLGKFGWGYFAFSVAAMILIHDAYFYWTHRFMHWGPVYQIFHRVHHQSTNPSPWAAFSFHPFEAVVEASIMLVFAFVLPVHWLALLIFMGWMTLFNVFGHLGYEIFPRWLTRSFFGKWLNTSTNHNQHHRYFRRNYGLYFRWWDIWMGTTHPDYEPELAGLQARPYLHREPAPQTAARPRV